MPSGYPDFEGNKSGLYLKGSWSEQGGLRKILSGVKVNAAFQENAFILYTVPAGKTLHITTLSAYCVASAVADADNNQICTLEVFTPLASDRQILAGLNGGGVFPLEQEIRVNEGDDFLELVYSYCNHTVNLACTARGYLI